MAYWISNTELDAITYPGLVPYRDPGADWGTGNALSNANYRIAYQFYVHRNCTLSAFKVFLSAVTNGGSLQPTDIVFELYSTNTDLTPGNKITDLGTLPDLTIGIKTITIGTPPSLSANTVYTIIARNINADPANNYVTIQWRIGGYFVTLPTSYYRSGYYSTSWSWTGGVPTSAFPNFEYALVENGETRYYGMIFNNSYSTYYITAVGNVLAIQTSLPYPCYLLGIRAYFNTFSGAGTDTIRTKVYDASGNILYSSDPYYYFATGAVYQLTTPYQLQANTTYRIGIEKVSGSSNLGMRILHYFGWLAYPTPYYYSGGSWTALTGMVAPMQLVLQPITSGNGSGGTTPPLPIVQTFM